MKRPASSDMLTIWWVDIDEHARRTRSAQGRADVLPPEYARRADGELKTGMSSHARRNEHMRKILLCRPSRMTDW